LGGGGGVAEGPLDEIKEKRNKKIVLLEDRKAFENPLPLQPSLPYLSLSPISPSPLCPLSYLSHIPNVI
jgi:hypothetical protein